MNESKPGMSRWLWPLRSRKVQVALATVITAFAAQAGFAWSEQAVTSVIAVGAALILGIAHEDAGRNRSGGGGAQSPRSSSNAS